MSKDKKTRSPLKEIPRNPGESIREELGRQINDKFMFLAMITLCGIAFVIWQWLHYFNVLSPVHPAIWTFFIFCLVVITIRAYVNVRKKVNALRQGYEGEKVVARRLEELRRKDFRVFHDIPVKIGEREFNIDHLLVGPKGVYVIETKTWSKPWRGRAEIAHDDERIWVDGQERDRNPMDQAKALRSFIWGFIHKRTGKKCKVWGVVIFPGWFVKEGESRSNSGIWVLNEKRLVKYLDQEPTVLNEEEIQMIDSYIQELYPRD